MLFLSLCLNLFAPHSTSLCLPLPRLLTVRRFFFCPRRVGKRSSVALSHATSPDGQKLLLLPTWRRQQVKRGPDPRDVS